MTLMK